MKKIYLLLLLVFSAKVYAQTPLYYQSNYVRMVHFNYNGNPDTLENPFTGGMNCPTFGKIDLNGDGIPDLFVFDRDKDESQFLNFIATGRNTIRYHFTPYYESAFPTDLFAWTYLADYNKDGLYDIFTHTETSVNSTGIKAYKNTSYTDAITKKYILNFKPYGEQLFVNDALGREKPLDLPMVSNSEIVDVDRDGFLDVLSFDESLNSVWYYRNQGKNKDTLKFYFTDRCWAKFEESGPHLYTPWDCNEYVTYDPKKHKNSSAHLSSAICALNVNGDNDIDLLIGDGLNDSLAMLMNAKSKNKNKRDTIVNISSSHNNNNYPFSDPAIINSMPMPSNLDIDNDGLKDLVVSAGFPTDTDINHSSRLNSIWYYKNEGDTQTPVFKLKETDFLQNTTVDWGVNSAPCFIDVDKDGRKDLIVAVRDGGKKRGFSHLVLYLNKPGRQAGFKPSFVFHDSDYIGLSKFPKNIQRPVPTAYFNGKDSITDLVMGNDSGQIMYFKDRSSGKKNSADFKLAQSHLNYLVKGVMTPINVGYNSSPTTADINKDGKTDLLIGASNGRISYYRCLGYGPAPDFIPYFELVNSSFGGINAVVGTSRQSAPCVADLNMNGKPDLLVGDIYGRVFYYPDFDTISTLKTDSLSLAYDYRTKQRSVNKLFSTWVIPAVMNIDQDTIPDIMLGCRRGGLFFLGSVNNNFEMLGKSGIQQDEVVLKAHMVLYPNPANDHLTLKYENSSSATPAILVVSDMVGRQLIHHSFTLAAGQQSENITTTKLPEGIYVISIIAADKVLTSEKIIISR